MVVAIIGILASLLLPALTSAREPVAAGGSPNRYAWPCDWIVNQSSYYAIVVDPMTRESQ